MAFVLGSLMLAQAFALASGPSLNVTCIADDHIDQFTLVSSDKTATLVWKNHPKEAVKGYPTSPAHESFEFPDWGCGRGTTLEIEPSTNKATLNVLSNYGCDGGDPETLICTPN